MNTQCATRISFFGSLVTLLAAGIVGCSSPVEPAAETSPLLKGKSTTTTTAWEKEPNNDPALANDVIGSATTGGGRQGWIATATDNDYFLTASIAAGKTVLINLAMPVGKDYDVQLLASDGVTVLASNHQGASFSESFSYTNMSGVSQTYKIRVFSYDGTFSASSPYTLVVGLR